MRDPYPPRGFSLFLSIVGNGVLSIRIGDESIIIDDINMNFVYYDCAKCCS